MGDIWNEHALVTIQSGFLRANIRRKRWDIIFDAAALQESASTPSTILHLKPGPVTDFFESVQDLRDGKAPKQRAGPSASAPCFGYLLGICTAFVKY